MSQDEERSGSYLDSVLLQRHQEMQSLSKMLQLVFLFLLMS